MVTCTNIRATSDFSLLGLFYLLISFTDSLSTIMNTARIPWVGFCISAGGAKDGLSPELGRRLKNQDIWFKKDLQTRIWLKE